MTTDERPPASKETPASVENPPTDPPLYREASTPEEVDESQKRDDKDSED
jgi:hypothetical protein